MAVTQRSTTGGVEAPSFGKMRTLNDPTGRTNDIEDAWVFKIAKAQMQ